MVYNNIVAEEPRTYTFQRVLVQNEGTNEQIIMRVAFDGHRVFVKEKVHYFKDNVGCDMKDNKVQLSKEYYYER